MAIPTMVEGVQFRSMLEARWARYFDLLGLEYCYEPFELDGYIPDFIIKPGTFYNTPKGLLVEVKPAMSSEELRQYVDKIDYSGWNAGAVIVGAHPLAALCWRPSDIPGRTTLWSPGHMPGAMVGWGFLCDPELSADTWRKAWKQAQNETQWKGKQNRGILAP